MSKSRNVPPEPTEIKKAMKALIGRMPGEAEKWLSLVAWYGNRLPQYLWTKQGWKNELSKKGYRWQDFLRLLSNHTQDIICWANDQLPWDKLTESIGANLNSSTRTPSPSAGPRNTKIDEY